MPAATDRFEFAPPPQPALLRAVALALLAHLLLLVALTWGVAWNRQTENVAVEAELWSSIPRQAAPRLVEAPPPPPPAPAPTQVQKPPEPVNRDADIALERQRKIEADKREAEEERRAAARLKAIEERREKEKLAERQRAEDAAQKRKLAEDRRKEEALAKRLEIAKAEARSKELEAQRQRNLNRIAGLAGAEGGAEARGDALRASGPSAGYAGRIVARIKPNIVFTDNLSGNPLAVVEVRAAPDGTIVGRKLVTPSGVASWDAAVLKAIDKTEVLPRDVDGRVPSTLEIRFRPKDLGL